MKSSYKMAAACALTFALAFTACDDSTSASDNGNGGESDSCNVQDMSAQLCTEAPAEGTICDARDGKIYKVATFDMQTWMTENLNYYNPCVIKSETWCYDNNNMNCVKYGRLYSWTAAMGIDSKFQKEYANLSGVQRGICPEGFHIPSDAETNVLAEYLEANGNDAELAFLFSGRKNFMGFEYLGKEALFWTSDEDHSEFGSERNVRIWTYSTEPFNYISGGSVLKDEGLSVRCVKD